MLVRGKNPAVELETLGGGKIGGGRSFFAKQWLRVYKLLLLQPSLSSLPNFFSLCG